MNNEELINVCQAVSHGKARQVWHLKSKKQGTVIGCEGTELTVKVGKSTETWGIEDCEERDLN